MHLRKATFILRDAFSRPVSKLSMFFNSQVERILENRFYFNDIKILEISGKKCFVLRGRMLQDCKVAKYELFCWQFSFILTALYDTINGCSQIFRIYFSEHL